MAPARKTWAPHGSRTSRTSRLKTMTLRVSPRQHPAEQHRAELELHGPEPLVAPSHAYGPYYASFRRRL
jgi:hypothetical protein